MEIGHCSANLTAHLEDSLSPRSSAVFVLEPFFDELLQLLDPGLFGQGQAVRGARWGLTCVVLVVSGDRQLDRGLGEAAAGEVQDALELLRGKGQRNTSTWKWVGHVLVREAAGSKPR